MPTNEQMAMLNDARRGDGPIGRAYRGLPPESSGGGWGGCLVLVLIVLVPLGIFAYHLGVHPATTTMTPVRPSGVATATTTRAPTATDTHRPVTSERNDSPQQEALKGRFRQALTLQAAADRVKVDAILAGRWVPQVSSRRIGLSTDTPAGVSAGDAWTNHQIWRKRFPQAELIWSGDWATFQHNDYWVTVIAQPFATARQANVWCQSNKLSPDDCFAKRLAHSGSPSENTETR